MSDGVFWPEFEQWLRAHGLDPSDVLELVWRHPYAGRNDDGNGGPQRIEARVLCRNAEGKPYLDEFGDPATEWRIVPMRHLPAVEVTRYR